VTTSWHALNESAYEQSQTGNGDDYEEARAHTAAKTQAKVHRVIDRCARRVAEIPGETLLLLPARRWSLAHQYQLLNRPNFHYSVGHVLLSSGVCDGSGLISSQKES
jgi:hypothetical protein